MGKQPVGIIKNQAGLGGVADIVTEDKYQKKRTYLAVKLSCNDKAYQYEVPLFKAEIIQRPESGPEVIKLFFHARLS